MDAISCRSGLAAASFRHVHPLSFDPSTTVKVSRTEGGNKYRQVCTEMHVQTCRWVLISIGGWWGVRVPSTVISIKLVVNGNIFSFIVR